MSNGNFPADQFQNRSWIELHLQPVKWSGDEAMIRCPHPEHPDRNPSASANASKGVWICHGCGQSGRLASLAKTIGVDPPMAPPTPLGAPERYDYRDAKGNLVFTVMRRPGKKFSIQAADGTRRMPKSGRGLPYRLPEVIAAAKAGKDIAIVEGEKDADRLVAIGIAATCNALGAGKWTKEHASHLPEGCKVVVMGDADLPGLPIW